MTARAFRFGKKALGLWPGTDYLPVTESTRDGRIVTKPEANFVALRGGGANKVHDEKPGRNRQTKSPIGSGCFTVGRMTFEISNDARYER